MAIKVTMKQSAYSNVEEGLYDAEITEVVASESQFGPQLKFSFTVLANDGTTDKPYPTKLTYFTSQKLSNHPKCKLNTLCKVLGVSIPGDELDVEELVGKSCKILVKNIEKKGNDGQPRTFSQIADILKAR
jgi:hypothetical protein